MIIENLDTLGKAASDKFQTVIIGGGTVGLYAAVELCKRGERVVVIESGGKELNSFDPATFSLAGLHHEGIRIGRSRTLGGTSNLWGGQLVEFQRADIDGRDWIPHSKWPVSYDEIAPYYDRTYENFGFSIETRSDSSIFEKVFKATPRFQEGIEMFLTRWLKVPSLAAAYDEQIRNDTNMLVLMHHTVTGFGGEGGKITSVQAVDRKGQTHEVHGDRFILASGTIEICRLMLHAAATPGWDCPWRNNPNVGAYFQDHFVGRAGSIQPADSRRFFNTFCNFVSAGHKFQPKIRLKNDTLESVRILNVQGTICFESSVSENLVFLKQFLKAAIYSRKFTGMGDLFRNLVACAKHLPPLMWKYVIENRIFVPSSSKISFGIQTEQVPLRDSKITIDSSVKDPFGLPKVILDWKNSEEELRSIREFVIRCDKALREAGLASLTISEELMNLNPSFLDKLSDVYHHTGGVRMAESESDGVVDRNLCVFGTENLYVLGASTFRTTSNANTTFLALTLTTRLVDHLSSVQP
jgi:choline dehydrogenase-like flavoprotein